METVYKYLGDRFTDPKLKGQRCQLIRRMDQKCIRGKNGNMLVQFFDGRKVVVMARLLRKQNLTEKEVKFLDLMADIIASNIIDKSRGSGAQNPDKNN